MLASFEEYACLGGDVQLPEREATMLQRSKVLSNKAACLMIHPPIEMTAFLLCNDAKILAKWFL
jgi:hypothetical protein